MTHFLHSQGPRTENVKYHIKKKVVYSVLFSNNFFCHGQPVFFNIKGYISFIKPDQAMWYQACKICSKKVTEAVGSGYWCEACQKNDEESSLR